MTGHDLDNTDAPALRAPRARGGAERALALRSLRRQDRSGRQLRTGRVHRTRRRRGVRGPQERSRRRTRRHPGQDARDREGRLPIPLVPERGQDRLLERRHSRRRRHQPSRPPPAKIRPGSPAPMMGPGTAAVLNCRSNTLHATPLMLALAPVTQPYLAAVCRSMPSALATA
jgi:hypothetical protein